MERAMMTKASQEHDRRTIRLEESFDEQAARRIARLEAENTQFKKSLLKKDRSVEELSRYRSHVEADLKALARRLESAEKENASLKYEVRVLEREPEIRHEEREFDRRVSQAAQKQHRESAEKIERLEAECRRLRSLVRKRLPGPAALTRMKNEVEKNNHLETRSGRSSPFRTEVAAGDASTERGRYLFLHSPGTLSDMGSDGKAESLVSALIADIEDFRNRKKYGTPSSGYMGTPDMNLMDDFTEMEKLAYHSPVACDAGNENKNNDSTTASIPIQKIIEILEGINIIPQDGDDGNPETYTVQVFRSETDEYSSVLKQFLGTCNDLLTGKGDLVQFVLSVASNLEWIVNHCFPLQDVSSITGYGGDIAYHQLKIEEDGEGLDLKLANKESSVADLEGSLQSQNDEVESYRIQLKGSKDLIENLESHVPTMVQPEDDIGDQAEEHKMMKQETETHLLGTKPDECNEPREEISLPENDMENYDNSYQESDESCNDLKTKLDGETGNEIPDDEKQLQNDMEITTASEKLAECQETLRNLGKQLKALASPRDAALFDKFVPTPADTIITTPSMPTPRGNGSQRFSLLDKMLAEDNNNTVQIGDPTSTTDAADPEEMGGDAERNAVVSMALVPRKKKDNRSFLKKMIWWQKKGRSKKTPFS